MRVYTTESGATYEVDPEAMRIRRNGPKADTDANKPDGEWLDIEDWGTTAVFLGGGVSLWFKFSDGRLRVTTPLVPRQG